MITQLHFFFVLTLASSSSSSSTSFATQPQLFSHLEHRYRGQHSSCYRGGEDRECGTSWHRSFKGTVDYLFHSEGIATRRVLLPPTSSVWRAIAKMVVGNFSVVADISLVFFHPHSRRRRVRLR